MQSSVGSGTHATLNLVHQERESAMFQFPPAVTNHEEQPDAVLDPVVHLIQAMRGFISRFTIALYGYREIELLSSGKGSATSTLVGQSVMHWFLDHAFTDSLVLNLRALIEDKKRSLGAGAIAHGLTDETARSGLCAYLDTCPADRRVTDNAERDKCLDYIAKYATLLATRPKPGETMHPLVAKAELIRRWANKSIAHLTLDHVEIHGDDLHHLVLAIAFVATAVEKVMGNAGCPTDLVVCEQQALQGGAALFGASPSFVGFMPQIREMFAFSLQTGKELPFA